MDVITFNDPQPDLGISFIGGSCNESFVKIGELFHIDINQCIAVFVASIDGQFQDDLVDDDDNQK